MSCISAAHAACRCTTGSLSHTRQMVPCISLRAFVGVQRCDRYHAAPSAASQPHRVSSTSWPTGPRQPLDLRWRLGRSARWPKQDFSTHAVPADLLRGVDNEHREDVARILDQAQRAAGDWTTVATDFYPPPVVADALAVVGRLADVAAVPWGGYSQAERCRLVLGRDEALAGVPEDPASSGSVALLQVKGNFMFDPATHRDFLGACLGTGIERAKVGDILVTGEAGAQLLVAPQLIDHLELTLKQVRSVPVEARQADLSELRVREARADPIQSIEASLRLDAVASAGFRTSRGKLADMIKSGDVRVNWKPVTKTSYSVKEGDLISCAGKGRLQVQTVVTTKKGKYVLDMIRYV